MDTSAVRFSDLPHGGATRRARTNAENPYLETHATHLPTFPYPRPEKASFTQEIDAVFPPRRRGQDAVLASHHPFARSRADGAHRSATTLTVSLATFPFRTPSHHHTR